MRARLRVFDPSGLTLRGVLPFVAESLRFSVEVGGGGDLRFTALAGDLDALSARDSVVVVQVETAPGTWTSVAAYALRPPFRRRRVGFAEVDCTGVGLLEAWASETVIAPEYTVGGMPRGAGTDRALGWQMTAYLPEADPREAWSGIYEPSRSTYPTQSLTRPGTAWPSGTGARWVSITGATDRAERKLFRNADDRPLTIPAAGPVRLFVASDSPGIFYIAGEPVLSVDGGEPGKEPILFQQADLYMQPGDYGCAFDSASVWDAGGDGVDPFIAAICTLDGDADPETWLLVTNDTDWVACRRDDEPPGDQPPGPTPGQLIAALVAEAQERAASGWAGVTLGFDGAVDSYSAPWPEIVVERNVRYASDTYWAVMQMLSETLEVDCWMGADLVLRAAPMQGQDRTGSVGLDDTQIATMNDTWQPDAGTWVAALGLAGWITGSQPGPRREYGMELGTAISMPVAGRVVAAALAENGRWDGSATLAPAASVVPLVTFNVGDSIAMDYADAPSAVRVLSVSASAGEGGLAWELELTDEVAS